MLSQHPPSGIPDGLPPDELERWSNELVGFLTSDRVPTSFRGWAHRQADLLDAYMASASDLESDGGAEEEDGEGEPAARAVTARQQAPRPAKAGGRRKIESRQGTLTLQLPDQAAKLIMGVVIGIVALGAIFGVRALTKEDSALPTTGGANTGAPPFDQTRASELEALLETDPTNQEALFEIGEMNFQAARNEETIVWFTKLVELDPNHTHAMTDLGTASFNLGKADIAKEWWKKVLAVDANDVQAHYNMGFAYANAEPRDLAAAVNEWETVVKLDPASQLAQTAKVHVEGLKAELKSGPTTAPAGAAPTTVAAPTAAAPAP